MQTVGMAVPPCRHQPMSSVPMDVLLRERPQAIQKGLHLLWRASLQQVRRTAMKDMVIRLLSKCEQREQLDTDNEQDRNALQRLKPCCNHKKGTVLRWIGYNPQDHCSVTLPFRTRFRSRTITAFPTTTRPVNEVLTSWPGKSSTSVSICSISSSLDEPSV